MMSAPSLSKARYSLEVASRLGYIRLGEPISVPANYAPQQLFPVRKSLTFMGELYFILMYDTTLIISIDMDDYASDSLQVYRESYFGYGAYCATKDGTVVMGITSQGNSVDPLMVLITLTR